MDLKEFYRKLKGFGPLKRKRGLSLFREEFRPVSDFGFTEVGICDDAAAIRHGGGYLLLAADGMMPEYIREHPYHAARSSILVNVNDIYAMGGRPLAVVDVLGGGGDDFISEVVRGLRDGAEMFRVPIVGGHYHPDSEPQLSVAVMGSARRLIRGDGAQDGDEVIAAYALSGSPGPRASYSFDAFSDKTPDELIRRREALCEIAQRGFASSCRDISGGGIIGALQALSHGSKRMFEVDIERVPRPDGIDLGDWLLTFPSYGFILSAPLEHAPSVVSIFDEVGASAAIVGRVRQGRGLRLVFKGESLDIKGQPEPGSIPELEAD